MLIDLLQKSEYFLLYFVLYSPLILVLCRMISFTWFASHRPEERYDRLAVF